MPSKRSSTSASSRRLRTDARAIFAAGLRAADPYEAILAQRARFGRILDRRYDHIYVVGAGKASATMALAIEKLLGARITGGLINVKHEHTEPLKRVRLNECGHPVPDEAGVAGAREIAEIAAQAYERDLVICLISGGASALLPLPARGLTLADKQGVTKLLLACGATIHEINTIRKHLSAIKGGRLAQLAAPATLLTLVLSDVIGDDLSVIGSGPTWPDASTFADARAILARYDLLDQVPAAVRRHLDAAAEETPKPGDPAFANAHTHIVGSNRIAVDACASEAKRRGYRPLVLSTTMEGETRDVARTHAAIAREIRSSARPAKPPVCLISGGETTVTIRETGGQGGRNQEFVLAAAIDLAGLDGVCVLSGGTDGTDGPTDAAGAIADGATIARAAALGLNAAQSLAGHDSYRFFDPLGDLISTGPTGTNVMDLRLVLVR